MKGLSGKYIEKISIENESDETQKFGISDFIFVSFKWIFLTVRLEALRLHKFSQVINFILTLKKFHYICSDLQPLVFWLHNVWSLYFCGTFWCDFYSASFFCVSSNPPVILLHLHHILTLLLVVRGKKMRTKKTPFLSAQKI